MFRIVCFLMLVSPIWSQKIDFDSAKPGTVPPDWSVAMTHEGGAPKWEIVSDPTAPSRPHVLAQTSTDKTSGRFPLAVYQRASFTNGSLTVRFKTISGERDQAAGLVWRYQDPDHYYIVRANALEDNVVLYKVEGGKRVPLEPKGTPPKTYGVKHKVPKQTWSTLKVSFDGSQFEVFFDGGKIMEVEDKTFSAPGKVGLWTKADSVTYFDDFQIEKKN
jgi:3-keto-disaccharide hydrolase